MEIGFVSENWVIGWFWIIGYGVKMNWIIGFRNCKIDCGWMIGLI